MTTPVKEAVKQTIDELSEDEVMELLEFLTHLHKKPDLTSQNNTRNFVKHLMSCSRNVRSIIGMELSDRIAAMVEHLSFH